MNHISSNSKPTLRKVNPEQLFDGTSKSIIEEGRLYFYHERAEIEYADDTSATIKVTEPGWVTANVEIYLDEDYPDRLVHIICNCPEAADKPQVLCKHKVCALLALKKNISVKTIPDWSKTLNEIISADVSRPKRKQLYIPYFEILASYGNGQIEPSLLSTEYLDQSIIGDRDAIARSIIDNDLNKHARDLYGSQLLNRIMPLSAADMAVMRLLAHQWMRFDMSIDTILPLLTESIVFHSVRSSDKLHQVFVISDNIPIEIELNTVKEGIAINAQAVIHGKKQPLSKRNAKIISESPMWIIAGSNVFRVSENCELVRNQIEKGAITVPKENDQEFFEKYMPALAERANISGNVLKGSQELRCEPIPRVYLSETEGELTAELRFAYNKYEIPFQKNASEVNTKWDADKQELVRVHRDSVLEEGKWKKLSSHGLKRTVGGESFVLRQNTHPVDFLVRHVPKLAEAGYEIYGEEDIKSVKVNRSRAKISLFVSSGIDWFDVRAIVNFGDQEVPLADIRKAIKKREHYIKLCDGSMGEIPAEWIERYKHLFDLAQDDGEGMRLTQSQVMLLDAALQEADTVDTDAKFKDQLARLKDFSSIKPKELPTGFVGELRHYQKSGYDWLHFLHEYGFGGCLADDMGLGKTIQALAFLRSLRETGDAKSVDMIVMPRSLLVNWEREAAKFTPDAKILMHADGDRVRDIDKFDGYDIVLTTYGVMLRDIDILSKYNFNYVILDESQVIKNPLSLTSRAARMLKSKNRLVLTGTPVENSTTELWSQFAFINPGMLGSLDYFKDEFAAPIERRGDNDAAGYLRNMVNPFILRRTKEQVAADLPPKVERVVYCDMDSHQHHLYNRIKDSYRTQLLGMIEESGMQGARMKILEGLLRLRQICNHPVLVEKTYKGASAKMEVLLNELDTLRAEGHKALVFSQFTQMLKILKIELNKREIPYLYLDGKTQNRQERVDEFQSTPDIPFFLISLKAGGVGLNLTAADYVIHIDPWWNPAVERQASDRTHRIGQDKSVFINKLIVRGTVEEKILDLQERKRKLVDQLITTESGFFKSLGADDVRELFG